MSIEKNNLIRKPFQKIGLLTVALGFMAGLPLIAEAGPRETAQRIHNRLAGVPAAAGTAGSPGVLDIMTSCLSTNTTLCDSVASTLTSSSDGAVKAAYIAMEDDAFYNVTLKNFAAPWTNEAQSVFVPLDDYSATVIGMIRDDVDFRTVLSADLVYIGSTTSPSYSNSDNLHYEAIEDSGVSLKTELTPIAQTALPGRGGIPAAGIMTTRAAARAFYIAGTNRAMLRFTMLNHLCKDMEQLKDTTRPSDRIRQDVSRSPGGDSRIFNNSCVGCHAGMDPLAQAYAHYEWTYTAGQEDSGQLTYDTTSRPVDANDPSLGTTAAQPKNLINPSNFSYGYITRDDSWTNYWRNGPNAILGWNGSQSSGQGASSMGAELANTSAFTSCQVRKVFQNVCLRDPMGNAADRTKINQVVSTIGTGPVNMKSIFAEAASYCKDGTAYQ